MHGVAAKLKTERNQIYIKSELFNWLWEVHKFHLNHQLWNNCVKSDSGDCHVDLVIVQQGTSIMGLS